MARLKKECDKYNEKNMKIEEENNVLKKNIIFEMDKVKYYKDFINLEDVRFESRFGNILSQLFTPTQIQLLLHPKKKSLLMDPRRYFFSDYFKEYIAKMCSLLKRKKNFHCQQIIEQLHNVGFNVIAMVSDMGLSNIGLWKALNIHIENTSFKHKITNQNIYVFADVPHLLKLARNHLIVKGFVLSKGKYIGKGVFEELVNLNSGQDYKLAHKFTKKHLLVEGTGLMKVKLAAELFLYTASEIILLFNDWFDLLNTQHKFEKKSIKSYGLNESNQNDLLEKMNSFIKSMRVHKKNLYCHFKKGILVTNISLKNLLIDIKNMNGLTYTMTRKLNQDILENLFSFLKGMTGCASNNITASDFKCCLRWFILGKHSHSVFSENTNIEDGHKDKLLNDCKCITSDLFYNLKLSEEICKDQLETESHNTCLKETDIPELHFDLLKQFEGCIS
ncbi:hypothetical protein QTP88_029675 [Uroleucon formosanum]